MVWRGFEFAAGFFLFGLLVALLGWVFGGAIHLLDWWSSRLSSDAAARRAKLTAIGHWPVPLSRKWTGRHFALLGSGIAFIVALQTVYLSCSR